jgi:hypothetical protein
VKHQYTETRAGAGMDDKAGETATGKALAMLTAFASVGARVFDLSITDTNSDEVEGLQRPGRSLEELRRMMGRTLEKAERDRHNVIIRPRSTTALLVQLDDLDSTKAERIAPHAFMVIRTSPGQDGTGNFQAWVAVKDAPAEKEAAKDFARRLRKGAGADLTASGATRISGSLNFKTKYAPAFPRVEITHATAGNVTSMAVLDQAGFVARREEARPPRPATSPPVTPSGRPSRKKWPSYALCVQHAPMTHGEDRPDISRADFTWCRTAIEWGWGIEDTAGRLMELSTKAKQEGEGYAVLTATNAAASVERQPYRAKSTLHPR